MNPFLEKLERIAERWIHIVDGDLHGSTVRILTGTIFTHDRSVTVAGCQEEMVSQDVESATMPLQPTREMHKAAPRLYPPVLKKAPASSK